jgi:tRNA modification GTPase
MKMNYMDDNGTIAALATAPGCGALAIIRISGKNAFSFAERCIDPPNKFKKASHQKIKLYKITDNETRKTIDEVTAIKYESPASYTGEDMVEIICHGNEIIIEEIISILIKQGVRLAKKGEFTRRAFLNGKMDLLKAESINQIINSTNPISYNRAIEIYNGKSKNILLAWKKEIIKILAEIDARIEFPEEDDFLEEKDKNKKSIKNLLSEIEKELKIREKINVLDSGFEIPIVGITNAGKSSLFNLILGYNRTIVHHEEGTTRDVISEEIKIKAAKVKLLDTAGINETNNTVELIGIEKSWEYIKNGNLIILVTPADKEISENEKAIIKEARNGKMIAIISKKDISLFGKKKEYFKAQDIPFVEVCLRNEEERHIILDFISSHINISFNFMEQGFGIICNKRQEEIIKRTDKKIKLVLEKMDNNYDEIISNELKEILFDMEEFVGETENEEILDKIFSEFCIGK